jgi:hypothetical protein
MNALFSFDLFMIYIPEYKLRIRIDCLAQKTVLLILQIISFISIAHKNHQVNIFIPNIFLKYYLSSEKRRHD